MSAESINHLRATIDQLRNELHEERSRVDALKSCLEQERQKYNKLSMTQSVDQHQPQSILISACGPELPDVASLVLKNRQFFLKAPPYLANLHSRFKTEKFSVLF